MSRRLPSDPRVFQIAVLGTLLLFGGLALDLPFSAPQLAVTLAAALAAQWVGTRAVGLPRFDPRSALITSMGLTLLLRTNDLWIAAFAGAVAIASKFLLRANDKHVFNPGMLGLVAAVGLTGKAWIAPGQWGNATLLAFGLACAGLFVTYRSARSDVTLAFLFGWVGVVVGRALWLGDPLSIPLHNLQNGALLLFAFFMISDPKTTPDRRSARIAWAVLVAGVAGLWQFVHWGNSGPIWALLFCSPLVPLLDRWLPGPRFEWSAPLTTSGTDHAQPPARDPRPAGHPRPVLG